MIWRRFEEINKADIDALIANEVSESRTIEYKQMLSLSTSDEKKEFVADVCAFANSAGGDILFGLEEQRDSTGKQTGVPIRADGLPDLNIDQEVQRIENLLRDCIEPRMPSLGIRIVEGFSQGPVLLIRVPQSWNAPHRSTRDSKFYARNNAGKYQMDIGEIRSAFLLSENLLSRLQQFRNERIDLVRAGITPIGLIAGATLVLHVVPRAALDSNHIVDLPAFVRPDENRQLILPFGNNWGEPRYNFDGFAICGDREYSQLFRTGAWESVSGHIAWDVNGVATIAGVALANDLVVALGKLLHAYQQLEITPPIFVMITLIGVSSCYLALEQRDRRLYQPRVDRDELSLPDILVDDLEAKPEQVLRPVLDTLWQTGGYARCSLYDQDGNWMG